MCCNCVRCLLGNIQSTRVYVQEPNTGNYDTVPLGMFILVFFALDAMTRRVLKHAGDLECRLSGGPSFPQKSKSRLIV